MGLDHVMLKVKDWPRAKEYYTSALKPLGYELIADWGNGGGFGVSTEKFGRIYVKQGMNGARSVQHALQSTASIQLLLSAPHIGDWCRA